MKFLIKIEEYINQLIESLLNKVKGLIPNSLFQIKPLLKYLIIFLKNIILKLVIFLKTKCQIQISHIGKKVISTRAYIMTGIMYIRSDEFKQADKKNLFLKPFYFIRHNPLKSFSGVLTMLIIAMALVTITQNTQKIAKGTLYLRKPASLELAENGDIIELKNHKFEVEIHAAAGGHGGGGAAEEHELFLDIKIEAKNTSEKEFLEEMEEMLDDNLEAMHLPITQLPLNPENQKKLEEIMKKSLNEDFKTLGHIDPIKNISLKQVLAGRPVYYRQSERMTDITDINLQIFLEDTNRNRQVWLDVSVLASNRNVILYLNSHEVELKDHLMTNVEPVIPQLPVEKEGQLIIKDKIKLEINNFLKENNIEGKILTVYINYLMAS